MEEKELFGLLTVYRGRGEFLQRREMFQKAFESFKVAAEAHPEDLKTLLSMTAVCMDDIQPTEALESLIMAMELEPNNLNAKYMRAKCMYFMSEFEKSLIQNHLGLRVRKKPPYFPEWLSIALETENDCVGEHAGPVMINFIPLLKKLEKVKTVTEEKETFGPKRVSRMPKAAAKVHESLTELKEKATLARVMAFKYLGTMANDKFFLKDLEIDKQVESANSNGSAELLRLIREGLFALSERQEMLRTRKPYYHIKYSEAKPSKQMLQEKEAKRLKMHRISFAIVNKLREKLEEAAEIGDAANLTRLTMRMQRFLNTRTKADLPEKDSITEKVYRTFAKGFLKQFKLSYDLEEYDNHRRIKMLMGMECGRAKRYDPVLSNRRIRPCEVDDVILEYRNIIINNQVPPSQLRCFMLFEIANMLLVLKEYTRAKYYSKRCMKEADEIDDPNWWFNALFVILAGEMQLLNTSDVRLVVEEGHNKTHKLSEKDEIRQFLSECMKVAFEAAAASDEKKALIKRQRSILSTMEVEERVTLQHIFKNMWSLPPGRRFSVLPKGTSNLTGPPERRRRLQPRMTVLPGHPRALLPPPYTRIPGFQIFDV